MDDPKKPKPVDVAKLDLDIIRDKTADLPGLIEYAHTVGGFSIVPTQQGVIKGRAMEAMKEQTQERLDMILEQMRVLAKQAQGIKDRVQISEEVYRADINFEPVMGKAYFLYRRANGKNVLSLVGRDEWGQGGMKYESCVAKIQLLSDHTWKVLERYDEKPLDHN